MRTLITLIKTVLALVFAIPHLIMGSFLWVFTIVMVKLFGKRKMNNKYGENERTLLINATIRGCRRFVKTLLNHNADASIRDKTGKTALTYAKEKKFTELIKILKKAGAKE